MKSQKILAVILIVFILCGSGFFDAAGVQTQGVTTTTILVFDTSSSMQDLDASGVIKLDAAKNAGHKLLDVISAENQAGNSANNQVGVVEFGDNAYVSANPTTDIDAVDRALSALYTSGRTAMPKGLKAALDLFPANPSGKSFIFLLSDGLPNIGLTDQEDESTVRQQVLDLASQAGQRQICVYTIGFGDPASGTIDEAFLRQVAANSGCGSYHNAANAWELANIYINLRHAATGTTLFANTGKIMQGQQLDIGTAQVPNNQSTILFTLNWPGSQLDANLRDPGGRVVDSSYPGAHLIVKGTLISIIIDNPQAGTWGIAIRGTSVPEGTTTYNVVLSSRPNPNPPTGTPAVISLPSTHPSSGRSELVIVFVVLAAVGVMIFVMIQARKGPGEQRATIGGSTIPGSLFGLNGMFAGRSIPLRDGFIIGRSSSSTLQLFEDIVSRQHARLRCVNGHWYIQDMRSQSGVYVNGRRTQATVLNRGDHIRIGSTEFEFR